jgi:hypothetical protein
MRSVDGGHLIRVGTRRCPGALLLAAALLAVGLVGCAVPDSDRARVPTVQRAQPSGWQQYADADSDSSVNAYETGPDYIRVLFSDGSVYLYTYASAGQSNIERMKELAAAGDGLTSFIMSNVRSKYESKQ